MGTLNTVITIKAARYTMARSVRTPAFNRQKAPGIVSSVALNSLVATGQAEIYITRV